MPSTRRKALLIASLVILAGFSPAPSAHAGPISDMLARRRMNQQMKIPPMDKPFSTKPIRDPNLNNVSLKERFKKRFSLMRSAPSGTIPMNRDPGVINTSR